MEWLLDNWIWVLVIGGMIAMHLFGHGHGGHDGHGKGQGDAGDPEGRTGGAKPGENAENPCEK